MTEPNGRQENQKRAQQQVDARILGRILAAQNVVFALPDAHRIAEFYAQILMTIPGITSCRVCLGGESVQAGKTANDVCSTCKTRGNLARENGTIVAPSSASFNCELADQPGIHGINIASDCHHFGFLVLQVEQEAFLKIYQPFIDNLSGYIALILENRWQKAMLKKNNDELELKVKERTHELMTANEELAAYRKHLKELVQERTAELEAKTTELERMNKLFVGRELRMVELKKIIEELKQRVV